MAAGAGSIYVEYRVRWKTGGIRPGDSVLVQGTDTDPWNNLRVGLEAVATLNRSEFDMKFNQALGSGNVLVGDKVKIALEISAILQT